MSTTAIILISFSAGIAFMLGVFGGILIATAGMRKMTNKNQADLNEINSRIEDRLEKYVGNTTRIAYALETMAEKKP